MRDISQQEMADKLDLKTTRAIRMIESGEINADTYVARWAEATRFPITWFYGEVA